MFTGPRARAFAALAELGLRRPAVLLVVVGLMMLAAASVIPGLGVSTSRTNLVSAEDPQQALLIDFYERFGRPENTVFLVSGGEVEDRRAVVDELQAKLEADPAFSGRVLGHIDADIAAPLLLLQQPQALLELRARLPPGTELTKLVESGLPGWFGLLEKQIYAQLGEGDEDEPEDEGDEGDDEEDAGEPAAPVPAAPVPAAPVQEGGPPSPASPGPLGAAPSPAELAAQADEGLRGLAMAAGVLDAVLAGEDPMQRLPEGASFGGQPGLDDRGYLVTAAGDSNLIIAYPELESDEGVAVAPIVARMRAMRDEVLADAPAGITADLTGTPALSADELDVLEYGLQVSTVATTFGIALLCMLLFRSLRQTIIALIPLAPGVLGTLAVVRLLYDNLNLVTSSFVAVLMGLGIDFSVHAISRFNEELRAGKDEKEAVRTAMVLTGPSVLTGAIVTAAAFLTSATTDFTAFSELGIVTALGLLIVVLCTFALLPALLRHKGSVRVPPEPPGLRALPGLARRLRVPLTVGSLLAAVAGAFALPHVGFNPRYFDFMPQTAESTRALDKLESDPLASPVFANLRADSIEDARAMATRLRALDSVAGVQSPSDLLPPLSAEQLGALKAGFAGLATPDFAALAAKSTTGPELVRAVSGVIDALDESRLAMNQVGMPTTAMDETLAAFKALRDRAKGLDDAGLARLATLEARAAALVQPAWETAAAVAERGGYAPSDLPPLFARRYVSKDGQLLALYAVPSGLFWEREVAERFRLDVVAIDPKVSGLATVHVRHGEIVMDGFRRAAVMAAVLVLIILTIDFRSLKDAVLALVPTVIGWLWMVGIMVLTGVRFDVANVVSMPLVLGIGIAFGVHMMHRCREVEQEQMAMELRLETIVRGTGGAIAVAALTTITGFGGLLIAAHGGMKSFGGVMMLGISMCLLATVLVLPALLLMIRRVK